MLLICNAPARRWAKTTWVGPFVPYLWPCHPSRAHTRPDKWRDRLDQEASKPAGRRLPGPVRKRHRSGAVDFIPGFQAPKHI